MDFIAALRNLFLQKTIPEQLGITDTEFFKRVLFVLPNRARIEFNQSEPNVWVKSLKHWSHRQNPEQYEADYYVITPAFVTKLSNLVDSAPQTLDVCHHMSAIDENGTLLFSSMDNFCTMEFREDVAVALGVLD